MYIHNINPVAFQLGQFSVYWYGLMYLIGFSALLLFISRRLKYYPCLKLNQRQLTDYVTLYCVLGVVLGGRFGYVFFYSFDRFLDNPLFLFKLWEGGMSFHGGLLGVIVATWIFCRKYAVNLRDFFDYALVGAPIGLMCGRIGNFIGGELWGKPTELPWGVVFPRAGVEPRHPSQLYEAGLEGLLLWLVLWWLASKPRPRMFISGAFLAGYGLARIGVEFVRQPDAHIGYLAYDFVTMGMLLTLPVLLIGLLVMLLALINNQYPTSRTSRAKPATTRRTSKPQRAKRSAR